MPCLERIAPFLALGGAIAIDDYDASSGCRRAVEEYFADKRDVFEFRKRSRLQIIRR